LIQLAKADALAFLCGLYFGVAVLSALATSSCALRSRGPFLKELVKRKRCSFG
jgi:hypothetical protein